MHYTPPKSLARYLAVDLALGAAVLNVIINGAIGALVYGGEAAVPFRGQGGVVSDTVLTIFLITFITALIVVPAARDEALAGKVPGLGKDPETTPWLRRLPDHARFRAIHLAIMAVLFLTPLAVGPWMLMGVESLPGSTVVLFKALVAGGTAAIVTPLVGLVGLGPVEDLASTRVAPRDESIASTPATSSVASTTAPAAYPFDYLDKACLACASPEHGCSNAPVWQLVYTGVIAEDHLREALRRLARRYPVLLMKTWAMDAVADRASRYAYVREPSWTVDTLLERVDLSEQPDTLDDEVHRIRQCWIDLLDGPPLKVTQLVTGDEGGRLLWQQQHALADGRGFIELLTDFGALLAAAERGEPDPEDVDVVPRRSELDALKAHGDEVMSFWAGARVFIGQKMRTKQRPIKALKPNLSRDFSGENDTVHLVMPDDALERWRPARKAAGVGLNAWLTAALFTAMRRWSLEDEVRPGWTTAKLIAETRPREGFRSFANHLSSFEVGYDLTDTPDPEALMQAIQTQTIADRDAKRYLQRLYFENRVVQKLPMHKLRRAIFDYEAPDTNLNFSNLIALPFPALAGTGWRVERVLITTPTVPPHGVVLTVIRYGGELVFNFNYKASVVSRGSVERLVAIFGEVLKAWTGMSRLGDN